jgi:hypothetical protein
MLEIAGNQERRQPPQVLKAKITKIVSYIIKLCHLHNSVYFFLSRLKINHMIKLQCVFILGTFNTDANSYFFSVSGQVN